MAPKNANADSTSEAPVGFTELEAKLIRAVLIFSERPSPDWDKVAEAVNSVSTSSVRTRFSQICQKHNLFKHIVPNETATPKEPKAMKTPTSGKRARSSTDDNDVDDTPTKKPRATPKKPKAMAKKKTEATAERASTVKKEKPKEEPNEETKKGIKEEIKEERVVDEIKAKVEDV